MNELIVLELELGDLNLRVFGGATNHVGNDRYNVFRSSKQWENQWYLWK